MDKTLKNKSKDKTKYNKKKLSNLFQMQIGRENQNKRNFLGASKKLSESLNPNISKTKIKI